MAAKKKGKKSHPHKGKRGRPKGSKNKKGHKAGRPKASSPMQRAFGIKVHSKAPKKHCKKCGHKKVPTARKSGLCSGCSK